MENQNTEKLTIILAFLSALTDILLNVFQITNLFTIPYQFIISFICLLVLLILYINIIIKVIKYKKRIKELNEKIEESNQKIEESNQKINNLSQELDKTKHLMDNLTLNNRNFISTVKYIIHSLSRTKFNEVELESVDITYEIKKNQTDDNYLDNYITYFFDGKNISDSIINSLHINTSIDFDDIETNIKSNAKDYRDTNNRRFTPRCTYDEAFQVFEWILPFEKKGVEKNNPFKYEFCLDWKYFFHTSDLTQILIDPKNYSIRTKSIRIKFINNANINIKFIQVYKFTRNPFDKQDPIILQKIDSTTWDQVISLNFEEDSVYILDFIQ